MFEDCRDLLQVGCGSLLVSRIQLYLKRAPFAVVKLNDGINLPAFVILVVEKPGPERFRIYLKIANRKGLEKERQDGAKGSEPIDIVLLI